MPWVAVSSACGTYKEVHCHVPTEKGIYMFGQVSRMNVWKKIHFMFKYAQNITQPSNIRPESWKAIIIGFGMGRVRSYLKIFWHARVSCYNMKRTTASMDSKITVGHA